MNIERIKKAKSEQGLSSIDIAQRSGIPVSTVYKILQGYTENPRHETVVAIEKALGIQSGEATQGISGVYEPPQDTVTVEESTIYGRKDAPVIMTGPNKMEYTTEDYCGLPGEYRCELIDGRIYDMGAPHIRHQTVINEISYQLTDYIKKNKGNCTVFPSNADVRLDLDDRTMVRPDIAIVCDRNKYKDGNVIEGAPDFIVEVISHSTEGNDYGLKLRKYRRAGVREYWIVDYHSRSVIVYDFTESSVVHMYTFADEVPVIIYAGKCTVDFRNIDELMQVMYGHYWEG